MSDALDYYDARLAIRGLTRAERRLFDRACCPVPRPPNGDTPILRKLEAKGLIVGHERSMPFYGGLRMTYQEWEVASPAVHLAWCDHCERKPLDDAPPKPAKPKPEGGLAAMMEASHE